MTVSVTEFISTTGLSASIRHKRGKKLSAAWMASKIIRPKMLIEELDFGL